VAPAPRAAEPPPAPDEAPAGGVPPPVPGAAGAPLNGLGVVDWLAEPLLDAAVNGLETMARTEVPPRLVPLAGRRHPKLSRAYRETIMSSLDAVHAGRPREPLAPRSVQEDLD